MDPWISGFNEVLRLLLGSPASRTEFWTIAGVAFVVQVLVVYKVGDLLNIPNSNVFRSLMVVSAGVLLTLLVMTAGHLYFSGYGWRMVMAVAGVLTAIFGVVPLMCYLHRSPYVSALIAWGVGVAAVAAAIFVLGNGFDVFASEGQKAGNILMHKQAAEDMIR